jgi:hypothetical protein
MRFRTSMILGLFVVALCSSARLIAKEASATGAQDKGDPDAKNVRPLKFVPKEAALLFKIGGKSTLTKFEDAEALEKLLGDSAKALAAQVDFKKEAIVLVSWTTSGPPDGVLKHELKDKAILFYIQGPPPGKARGERARIGADFFAVPRDAKVTFDPKER